MKATLVYLMARLTVAGVDMASHLQSKLPLYAALATVAGYITWRLWRKAS